MTGKSSPNHPFRVIFFFFDFFETLFVWSPHYFLFHSASWHLGDQIHFSPFPFLSPSCPPSLICEPPQAIVLLIIRLPLQSCASVSSSLCSWLALQPIAGLDSLGAAQCRRILCRVLLQLVRPARKAMLSGKGWCRLSGVCCFRRHIGQNG